VWFQGRKKEIIVRGGSNISPQEVEETLYQHPAVAEGGFPFVGRRLEKDLGFPGLSAELTVCAAAIARTLHCVASFGGVFIVASTIAASRSAEIRLGRPLRGRSSRIPAMPSLSNRFRHNSTVGTDVHSFRARTLLGLADEIRNFIRENDQALKEKGIGLLGVSQAAGIGEAAAIHAPTSPE
jgi:hypothetical protein